ERGVNAAFSVALVQLTPSSEYQTSFFQYHIKELLSSSEPPMFPKSKSRGKNDFFRRGIIRMLPLCKPKGSRAAGFFFLDLITQNPRWSVSEVRRNECGVKNCHDYFMRRTSSSLLFSRFSAKGSRRVCGPLLSK